MSELMSDDYDEPVILASATIISVVVYFCVITVLREKGVILCGFEVICSLVHITALTTASCEI